jgi:threonine/homoserine/homoserine lactone efflux protein
MNVKLRVLSAGVLFFIGGQMLLAQKTNQKKDTATKVKDIEEVVVVGYTKKKQGCCNFCCFKH